MIKSCIVPTGEQERCGSEGREARWVGRSRTPALTQEAPIRTHAAISPNGGLGLPRTHDPGGRASGPEGPCPRPGGAEGRLEAALEFRGPGVRVPKACGLPALLRGYRVGCTVSQAREGRGWRRCGRGGRGGGREEAELRGRPSPGRRRGARSSPRRAAPCPARPPRLLHGGPPSQLRGRGHRGRREPWRATATRRRNACRSLARP